MGMLVYDALILARVARENQQKKRVLTLGVPQLNFSDHDYRRISGDPTASFSNHTGFFHYLGFETVDSLDISDYEGANIIGDLNDAGLPGLIPEQYDLIFDAGTLEHIFEAPTAMKTLSKITAMNGAIVHSSPANGFMDHGFWQLSPDLFRSFYPAQGFSILTSALFVLGRFPLALSAENNIYRTNGRAFIVDNVPESLIIFAARKVRNVEQSTIRLQDYYRQMHQGEAGGTKMEFFIPFGSPAMAALGRRKILGSAINFLAKLRAGLRGMRAGGRR